MKYRIIAALPILALIGAGCDLPEGMVSTGGTDSPVKPAPEAKNGSTCPITQVFFFNKLAFSASEITSINTNVVNPYLEYYRGRPGTTVMSITIQRTSTGINFEAILDQPGTDDPIYEGFIHPRTGSSYPLWEPIDAGPGYEG